MLLKPSPQTPVCSSPLLQTSLTFYQLTAERLAEAFTKAGLPKDVLQVLHLSSDLVRHVIQHPKVNYISFTGSVAGGRDVDKAAAETGDFKTVGLEVSPQRLSVEFIPETLRSLEAKTPRTFVEMPISISLWGSLSMGLCSTQVKAAALSR